MSIGFTWASRLTTVGLQFALPPILGYVVDQWLGTQPAGTLIGAVLGFTVGMLELMRIARSPVAKR